MDHSFIHHSLIEPVMKGKEKEGRGKVHSVKSSVIRGEQEKTNKKITTKNVIWNQTASSFRIMVS